MSENASGAKIVLVVIFGKKGNCMKISNNQNENDITVIYYFTSFPLDELYCRA
jgi:hypothetical protein